MIMELLQQLSEGFGVEGRDMGDHIDILSHVL